MVAARGEQGFAPAQDYLGQLYELGQGVAQDSREALRWYRRAAEDGWASAQFHLGRMHRDGSGVVQDLAEAARWFRKAAEQGDAEAQFNLAYFEKKIAARPAEAASWYCALLNRDMLPHS